MNPPLEVSRGNKSLVSLSVACGLLGFLLTWAYKTQVTNLQTGGGRTAPSSAAIAIELKQNRVQREEIQNLRTKLAEFEQASSTRTKLTEVLSKEIEQTKIFAGLVDVEGQGITVILRDSQHAPAASPEIVKRRYAIHDTDLVQVVNELKAAGAEVVAVNGHRIAAQSSIRCAGPVVFVDGARVGSPFRIEAIGNPETLQSAMDLPGGVLSDIRLTDPRMAEVIVADRIMVPSYAGSSTNEYAKISEKKSR